MGYGPRRISPLRLCRFATAVVNPCVACFGALLGHLAVGRLSPSSISAKSAASRLEVEVCASTSSLAEAQLLRGRTRRKLKQHTGQFVRFKGALVPRIKNQSL